MKLHFTKLFTVANVCAMLALFVALGGVSYAAVSIPRNSVASKQVKNESLTGRDIKNNTLVGADIKESSLIGVQTANTANTANTATTANTANTLSSVVDSGRKLVTATSGVDAATALAAAPKVSLLTVGSLSLYGKCYTDASGPSTHGEVFIATTLDGVVFDSDQDDSNSAGSNFLNVAALESDRQIQTRSAGLDSDSASSGTHDGFYALTAAGLNMHGSVWITIKNGTLAGGNGFYGAGDKCTFNAISQTLA